eukprot:COSAG05_NODE_20594_length_278_cov_0.581006_1_plen_42_part_01
MQRGRTPWVHWTGEDPKVACSKAATPVAASCSMLPTSPKGSE